MSVCRIGALLLATIFFVAQSAQGALGSAPHRPMDYAIAGNQAAATLMRVFYAGTGLWRNCNRRICQANDSDWGADSATYTLYLRWSTSHNPAIRHVAQALASSAPSYPKRCTSPACPQWSDTAEWDAVATMREYDISKNATALAKAEAAYHFVERSTVFARGACPAIRYQRPNHAGGVKTLETDANAIKAALLIYQATRARNYLAAAVKRYAAVRRYYLDPRFPLYTVHVIDNGRRCVQVAHRFSASVNGDMIENGILLSRMTGVKEYDREAIATAKAIDAYLSDSRGIFTDLQGENDVVEPLVEAMYDLASSGHQWFARAWILRNASAALSARAPDGTFERFFDGPSEAQSSVWQCNGGLALEIAAGALAPKSALRSGDAWNQGRYVGSAITKLPTTIAFDGSGIALIGVMGRMWEASHVQVWIDGKPTFDRTGLWQNKSLPDGRDTSILFAWRWPHAGEHTITLRGDAPGAYLHLNTYVMK